MKHHEQMSCCEEKEKTEEVAKESSEEIPAVTGAGAAEVRPKSLKREYLLPASILAAALVVAGAWIYTATLRASNSPGGETLSAKQIQKLKDKVLPADGIVLPVRWGDLGVKMTEAGVIDKEKFVALYDDRGGMGAEERKLLEATDNGNLKINEDNAGMLLNLLWALGLGSKNDILESGPMKDPRYGGADRFASTGGWPLAKGGVMDHYSRHTFFNLTPEQQALVFEVAQNVYRPCCNNPTHFPDCNHGMAMLGLLELMAAQGATPEQMYKAALAVNAYWFPDTYMTIAQYLATKGTDWEKVEPKGILGANFSSASGYQQILKEAQPVQQGGGGGCGV